MQWESCRFVSWIRRLDILSPPCTVYVYWIRLDETEAWSQSSYDVIKKKKLTLSFILTEKAAEGTETGIETEEAAGGMIEDEIEDRFFF